MDKIEKFLKKLSPDERGIALRIIEKVLSRDIRGLDIKKLKGEHNLFRVRKGNIRIVFFQGNSIVRIIFIGRRSKKTYKDF